MSRPPAAPPPVFQTVVPRAWIDANGHMNVASYVTAFDEAIEAFQESLGCGAGYTARTDCTCYVADLHALYRHEVKEGESVAITAQVLGADNKRLHLFMRLDSARHSNAALAEVLLVHVQRGAGRVTPFPDSLAQKLAERARVDSRLGRPAEVGQGIRGLATSLPSH